jgi:hypothetical protein
MTPAASTGAREQSSISYAASRVAAYADAGACYCAQPDATGARAPRRVLGAARTKLPKPLASRPVAHHID